MSFSDSIAQKKVQVSTYAENCAVTTTREPTSNTDLDGVISEQHQRFNNSINRLECSGAWGLAESLRKIMDPRTFKKTGN